jgi:transcriptional regulator with PAS, ATPase and Fis domain
MSEVLLRALGELGGAALVLAPDLTIAGATDDAEALLGEALPVGAPIVKLLCGRAMERPVAEALAAGRAISAVVPRPRPGGGEIVLNVRALPLRDGDAPAGWLLLLDVAPEALGGEGPVDFHGIVTRDPAMKRVFRIMEKVARTDTNVLVRGDTGAGKELVARAVHALSDRRAGPFRALNCAALPPTLLESELFGHVRGAFTGAVRDNPGHFRLADGGSIFLDEVAELPLELQAKLLRVLETRTVIPIGAQDPVPVDVRIIAATHRALRTEVEAGRFRADLMFRLRVVPIFLPPLRDRTGDVMLLAQRFVQELNARGGRRVERVAPGAQTVLERHDWPGNVRELRNVLEYAFVIGEGPVLVEADLPPELLDPSLAGGAPPAANLPPASEEEDAEVARIRRALERTGGNRERAARMLGVSRATLWRRMKAAGLED